MMMALKGSAATATAAAEETSESLSVGDTNGKWEMENEAGTHSVSQSVYA